MAGTVLINFDGNAEGVRSAANMASDSLNFFQTVMASAADAARVFSASFTTGQIQAYADTVDLARQTVLTLTEASNVLGPAFEMQAQAFLDAAASGDDYRERLAMVQAQVDAASSSAEAAAGKETGGGFAALSGALSDGWSAMGQWINQSSSFITSLMAWSVIQEVTQWVQDLATQLFQLNVQTEKSVNGWQYLFSGPNGPSKQNAQALANWSYTYSMQIPFTRQDLMSSITTMGAAGMNTQQLEQFLPYLSDLAATYGSAAYGGQGTTLAQAAQAVRMAKEGRSVRLKYDLNINPEDLIPYGLKATGTGMGLHITDPNSLFRALENYARAKHVVGASQQMTSTTWWGGFSSATDQLQNFLLQAGGTDASGSIRKGSFFATIKADLFDLMDWATSHSSQMITFADTLSRLIGTVVDSGGGMLGAFFDWVGKIGTVSNVMDVINAVTTNIETLFLGTSTPGITLPSTQPYTTTATTSQRTSRIHNAGDYGAGGSGGRAAPAGSHAPQQHAATGIDWNDMPVIGGLLHTLGTVDWGPITKGLDALGKGWASFAKGFGGTIGSQMQGGLRILGDFAGLAANQAIRSIGDVLRGIGQSFQVLGDILQAVEPYFKPMSDALNTMADRLEKLFSVLFSGDPKRITDAWNALFAPFNAHMPSLPSWGQVGNWFQHEFGGSPPGGYGGNHPK